MDGRLGWDAHGLILRPDNLSLSQAFYGGESLRRLGFAVSFLWLEVVSKVKKVVYPAEGFLPTNRGTASMISMRRTDMTEPDFVKQMQDSLRQQEAQQKLANDETLHNATVLETEGPKE
jgi:hypothetical protein